MVVQVRRAVIRQVKRQQIIGHVPIFEAMVAFNDDDWRLVGFGQNPLDIFQDAGVQIGQLGGVAFAFLGVLRVRVERAVHVENIGWVGVDDVGIDEFRSGHLGDFRQQLQHQIGPRGLTFQVAQSDLGT